MPKTRLFTSESVCAGHPDKICDGISDAIVDALLKQDPNSRAGVETVAGANQIALFGEIKTTGHIDFEDIVRQKVQSLGYTVPAWGFSHESVFSNDIHQQSPEIAMGVDDGGAGDQGMMFGFACNETSELMPVPIALAHSLTLRIDEAREKGELKWLRPDGKAQVTVRYEDDKPVAVEKLVAAVAHDEQTSAEQVRSDIINFIFIPVLEKYKLELPAEENITVNGTGLWHIPGPESDAGLTGRKIVVDTYGGYARVGGGAFSGKDPSKVDRSGAYAARFIAKNIVASGLATKCEVGLAYVIGQPRPLMQTIDTFGEIKTTGHIDFEDIVRQKVQSLGYTVPAWGFSHESVFSNDIHQQSPEIAMGVDDGGAGDQGMMFGFACNETSELMPVPIALAHSLTLRIDEAREKGELKWLRPDGKAQVTVRYEDDKPVAVEKLVAAVAHDEQTSAEQVRSDIINFIFIPVLEKYKLELPAEENITVNGTGLWHIPGPESDAGLTGRKIVVDTYGGYARVGGGAFSGKDPSKVDRSGAYAARFIAKNIVASGLATKCEVGLAYVIGQPRPLMQTIDTFGTATASDQALEDFKNKLIDTSVRGILERLDLLRPIYQLTSAYGHFGRPEFPWEAVVEI